MVASASWTDPKSGANYSFGDKLPASDFNSWIDGIRTLDTAAALALRNMTSIDCTSLTMMYDATWDESKGVLICVGETTGNAPTSDLIGDGTAIQSLPTAGTLTSLSAVASDNDAVPSYIVAGGSVSGSTAAKIRRSSDGGVTWSNVSTSATNDHNVRTIVDFNAIFVAFLGGGTGTATIESSPSGATWTARTNSASNTDWIAARFGGIATDGTTLVAVPSGTGNTLVYTTNGTSFSNATLSASTTWRAVAYTAEFGWAVYSTDGSTINHSSNGTTWAAATLETAPSTLAQVDSLESIGNVLVLAWEDTEGAARLSYSTDGGATWIHFASASDDDFSGMRVAGGRVVWFGDSTDRRILVSDRGVV